MSIPYNSVASQPQGLEVVTIDLITYIVDSVDIPSNENRTISRTDENGDRSDFMIRAGSDQITGTLTLQRASTSTVLPPEGKLFTYDFDRSGTASSLVISGVNVNRGKDDMDTFSVDVVLAAYQS